MWVNDAASHDLVHMVDGIYSENSLAGTAPQEEEEDASSWSTRSRVLSAYYTLGLQTERQTDSQTSYIHV